MKWIEAAAGTGRSEHWKRSPLPSRAARKPRLPRASLRAQDRSRGDNRHTQPQQPVPQRRIRGAIKACPYKPLAACPQPTRGMKRIEAAAGTGRSEHWKRSPLPSRKARKPILPRASLRAQDRSRGAPRRIHPSDPSGLKWPTRLRLLPCRSGTGSHNFTPQACNHCRLLTPNP
jgi:hypothetical protein